VTGFFPLILTTDGTPHTPYRPPPVVGVYGDSFTTGFAGYGQDGANWVARVGERVGATMANNAVGGTGYVYQANGSTFPHRASVYPVPHAALVVFFGGFNDRLIPDPAPVGLAAEVAFIATRRASPRARLLVVGPQWPGMFGPPPPLIHWHRDAIRDAAYRVGAHWVDPLAEGWFTDRPDLIWPLDAIHPNDLGHAYLADLIAPHVAALLPQETR
jgi:hypothetical protein